MKKNCEVFLITSFSRDIMGSISVSISIVVFSSSMSVSIFVVVFSSSILMASSFWQYQYFPSSPMWSKINLYLLLLMLFTIAFYPVHFDLVAGVTMIRSHIAIAAAVSWLHCVFNMIQRTLFLLLPQYLIFLVNCVCLWHLYWIIITTKILHEILHMQDRQ